MVTLSVIPSTGFTGLLDANDYEVFEHILPTEHQAHWGFGGVDPLPGGGSPVSSISETVGDSSADVASGVVGGVTAEVLATLRQQAVFGTVLLDWMAGALVAIFAQCEVPPPIVFDPCPAPDSDIAACGAPPETAWSACNG